MIFDLKDTLMVFVELIAWLERVYLFGNGGIGRL